jgi:hypothetical protein
MSAQRNRIGLLLVGASFILNAHAASAGRAVRVRVRSSTPLGELRASRGEVTTPITGLKDALRPRMKIRVGGSEMVLTDYGPNSYEERFRNVVLGNRHGARAADVGVRFIRSSKALQLARALDSSSERLVVAPDALAEARIPELRPGAGFPVDQLVTIAAAWFDGVRYGKLEKIQVARLPEPAELTLAGLLHQWGRAGHAHITEAILSDMADAVGSWIDPVATVVEQLGHRLVDVTDITYEHERRARWGIGTMDAKDLHRIATPELEEIVGRYWGRGVKRLTGRIPTGFGVWLSLRPAEP